MKTDSWHILIGMKTTKSSTANQQIPHSLHLCLPVHEAHVKMRSKHASLQGSGHHKASTYWRICIWVHYFISYPSGSKLFIHWLPSMFDDSAKLKLCWSLKLSQPKFAANQASR